MERLDPSADVELGLWRYVWSGVPRPFVHPVTTPSGRVLTVDAPGDHPWHHALWFTIKFVDGDNFWEEYDRFGLLVHTAPPEVVHDDDGSVTCRGSLEWRRPEGGDATPGEAALREERTLVLRPSGDALALDWDLRLSPVADAVLDRTPFTTWGGYGGLTVRGRPEWHDTELRLPGRAGRDRVLGEWAEWCALDGLLESAEVGLVMFDHPDNPSFPTPWYASTRADTYGEGWSNFCNAAFLWDGPRTIAAGDELRIRHRVLTHDGRWGAQRLAEEWRDWLATAPT